MIVTQLIEGIFSFPLRTFWGRQILGDPCKEPHLLFIHQFVVPPTWTLAFVMGLLLLLLLSRSVVSNSVPSHRQQPTRLPHPWDSPGKNTGVGYHFLLQCMKVKSEREVAQSCPTLSNPMDCSLPGSSAHGILQARVREWVAIAFSFSANGILTEALKMPAHWNILL